MRASLYASLFVTSSLYSLPAQTPPPSTLLVPQGSVWRYLDDGSNQGTAWSAPSFDDSLWASGPAELGYGDGNEATVVNSGPAPNRYITTYFRHTFQVVDPNVINGVCLSLLWDDGAVVYLNGTEILRPFMPAGPISYTTQAAEAVSGAQESTFTPFSPSAAQLLVAGSNVLAVEIHQVRPTSSDISFDLEMYGTTSTECVVRGPYLQRGAPDSAVLRWGTHAASSSVVWLGPSPAGLAPAAMDATLVTDHEIAVSGLTPDTLYYYAVGNSQGMQAGGDNDHYFVTAPAPGAAKPTRVWVLGDAGASAAGAAAVRDGFGIFSQGQKPDMVLMLGDNAYPTGSNADYQKAVFETYHEHLRNTVFWSAFGDVDGQSASSVTQTGDYYDIFSLPTAAEAGGTASGSESYYSFDHGDIHFICLDTAETNLASGGPMLSWLQSDLIATQATWVVAFFHHPPYTKGSHDSDDPLDSGGRLFDVRQNVLPILEAHGVDLVLASHSQSYERSFLLDGHYGTSPTLAPSMILDLGDGDPNGDGDYAKPTLPPAPNEGTVYVVAGSAAATGGGLLNHPAMVRSLNSLGSFVLDIDGNQLVGSFVDAGGTVNDTFTIEKGLKRSLIRRQPRMSLMTGGTQSLSLDAGPASAGRLYVIAGSFGTSPGFIYGVPVPLNFDPYFSMTLFLANTPFFQNSANVLDGNGRSQASINLPRFNSAQLIGVVLHHAFVVFGPTGIPSFASNAVRFTMDP